MFSMEEVHEFKEQKARYELIENKIEQRLMRVLTDLLIIESEGSYYIEGIQNINMEENTLYFEMGGGDTNGIDVSLPADVLWSDDYLNYEPDIVVINQSKHSFIEEQFLSSLIKQVSI